MTSDTDLITVARRGEWFWVRGRYRGQVLEVMVPAYQEQREGERAFHRALRQLGMAREGGMAQV